MRANRALIVSQGTDCFNQIQNARLDVGQALRDTQSRPVHRVFVEKNDPHNLLARIAKRDGAHSAMPQKSYGVPAHRVDNN